MRLFLILIFGFLFAAEPAFASFACISPNIDSMLIEPFRNRSEIFVAKRLGYNAKTDMDQFEVVEVLNGSMVSGSEIDLKCRVNWEYPNPKYSPCINFLLQDWPEVELIVAHRPREFEKDAVEGIMLVESACGEFDFGNHHNRRWNLPRNNRTFDINTLRFEYVYYPRFVYLLLFSALFYIWYRIYNARLMRGIATSHHPSSGH